MRRRVSAGARTATGSISPARCISKPGCLPCDPSSFTHWRQRLDEAGIEGVLSRTVEAAKAMRSVAIKDVCRVIIDSKVQEKAIAYSTDIQLLEIVRLKLVKLTLEEGFALRQSYEREGPKLRRRAGGKAHAGQVQALEARLAPAKDSPWPPDA